MPPRLPLALACCAAALAASAVQAQEFDRDARVELRLSGFNPEANIRFAGDAIASNGERTETLAAAGDIGVDGRWRPRGELAFHMSPRQSLRASYYDYRRSNHWRFDGDWIDPGDVFEEVEVPGDPVEVPAIDFSGRISFELASLNYDFAAVQTPTFEWGIGLGLTHATFEATATGSSSGTAELDPQWEQVQWKRDGTSPNLHTRVSWTPAPRWRIEAQGQYLDTRWGDFVDERGHFERGGLLLEYLLTERIAIHAGYDWFRLKLSDDYRGSFDAPAESDIGTADVSGRLAGQFKVHGPMAGLTFRF